MKKEFTIYNYDENPAKFTLLEIESILLVTLMLISGDEVLKVYYNDGRMFLFDSGYCDRTVSLYDDEIVITLDDVDDLIKFPNASEFFEHIRQKRIAKLNDTTKEI